MSKISIIKIVLCFFLIIINGCIPTLSAQSLFESHHPYANNLTDESYDITMPDATQMRLHFKYIDINSDHPGDRLTLYDGFGRQLKSYPSGLAFGYHNESIWTDWYKTDIIKVKLETDDSGTAKGFIIDNVETRTDMAPSSDLPESYDQYANNFEYTWPDIIRSNATQMRLHFKYIDINSDSPGDRLTLYDGFGRQLKSYPSGLAFGYHNESIWTDWYKTDIIKVKLETDDSGTAKGFIIDNVESNNAESNDVESDDVESNDVESNKVRSNNNLTATTLTSSTNLTTSGQPVTLTAEVDTLSQETEEPSGTVTFMDGTTSIGTVDVSSGQATLITSKLSGGSHSVTAGYSGDNNFEPSTSSSFPLTVQNDNSNPSVQDDNSNPSDHLDYTFILNNINTIVGIISAIVGIIVAIKGFQKKFT